MKWMNASLCFSFFVLSLSGCKKNTPPDTIALTPSTVDPAVLLAPSARPTVEEAKPEPPKPSKKALLNQVNDAVALLTLGTNEAAQRALSILKNVVNSDDSIAYAHFNVGVAHQSLNQLGAARMAFERALDADQSFARAWLAVGLLQDVAGNPSRAIVKYRQGLEYAPDDIDLHVALIGSLRRQNRLSDAIAAAKSALKNNANSLAIYNELGLVYLAKNDLNMARFVYVKAKLAVDGGKNNAAIRCNLGRVLYLQDETKKAGGELEEAYALDQKHFSTLVYLSEVYFDNRAYGKAVPLLEEARRQQPEHHGVAMNLGLAYRGVGRYPDSKRLYEDALRIDAGKSDPYLNLGILFGDYLKDYDASLEAFNKYVSMGGNRKDDALVYITKIEKERKRASKKRQQDVDRKKREAERAERERLLKEAEEKAKREADANSASTQPWGQPGADSAPKSPTTAPQDAPTEEPKSTDGDTKSPWE
jgi:tetratricopeptide (TPR) repeat protein